MAQGSFVRLGGAVFDAAIRLWLRVFGRRIDVDAAPWMSGAVGENASIGPGVYDDVARQMHLHVAHGPSGLMPDFSALHGPAFDPDRVHPAIKDFYERTSEYSLDAWAEWSKSFRPLARVLVGLISRRVDQLNLPVRALDTSGGVKSDVIPLVDGAGTQRATGWLRRLKQDDRVIYAGIYQIVDVPGFQGPCVKVVFPLPRGNVAAILHPEAWTDSSFALTSKGRRFGDPGMYRSLALDEDARHRRVRHIRAMHELIHVYVDGDGELRTSHDFSFFRHRMLRIHYRIHASVEAAGSAATSV